MEMKRWSLFKKSLGRRIIEKLNPFYWFFRKMGASQKAKKIEEDSSWLKDTRGKVFKMVSMLLYDLPTEEKYKVIFMKRNMDEVLTSQSKMLNRLKQEPGTDYENMKVIFSVHLKKMYKWLKQQKNISVLYASYNHLLKNPFMETEIINEFLDMNLDIKKMAEVVDQKLYRNRFDA